MIMEEHRRPGRPSNLEIAAREQTKTEVESSGKITRSSRKPFGAAIQKLAYPQRENFHRHWFNDEAGRIDHAEECGWTHVVESTTGKNVVRIVGTTPTGTPLMAFLMEIPEEWYQDDMKVYQDEINEKEAAIKRGDSDRKDGDGRYIPSQGINIKS